MILDHTRTQSLMLRRADNPHMGKLCCVGGKKEPMEFPDATMAREMWEESGLLPTDFQVIHKLMMLVYPDGWSITYYYGVLKEEYVLKESDEGSLEWIDLGNATVLHNPDIGFSGVSAFMTHLACLKEGIYA